MMNERNFVGRAALPSCLAAVLVLAGCAAKTPSPEAAPAAKALAGAVLEYKMPAGRALTYQSSSEDAQVMEVMGQTMDTHTANTSAFTFKAKGRKEKDLLLSVTIDDIAASVTGAQGDLSPDMSSVKGKSFDMVLSPLGSEVDVSGAEALTYAIATETRNLASGFKAFFPDLPGRAIKVGDTWPSTDAVEEKTGSLTIQIQLQNVHTLEGFETVDGMECARVSTEISGTISGSGNQMGQDMTFSGTSKGKNVWHFAVKEGIYVKAASELKTEMSIEVSSAGMTIPMSQTSKGEVKLAGKR
jgi:hypothetical protein